ncbi:MAG: TFIIH/NER complex subunit [Chrysothrix sp. TS-e1954]|nr:MAG: TFIIH/NER complex subunit [Chrysothrix sp. TS-e1954]
MRDMDDSNNSFPLTQTDESCPNCRKTRYMNPSIKFLISRVCYHKMCSGCRDRIFAAGPANCPIAGCKHTLRLAQFTPQRFEDVQIEREVDIRRRVAEVFNRREEEFEDLQVWNDYLEMVENLTYELIFGDAKQQAEAKGRLERYKEANGRSIGRNATAEREQVKSLEARGRQEKEVARAHRVAAKKEYDDEVKAKADKEQRIVQQLASGEGDAQGIVNQEERDARKKAGVAKKTALAARADATMNGNDAFVIRGLKKREAPPKEMPYEPFGGLELKREYFTLQDHYSWEWLNKARNDVKISAGGYDTAAYAQRALCDAFSGFGVFVGEGEDEAVDIGSSTADPAIIAASAAGNASHVESKDDVF